MDLERSNGFIDKAKSIIRSNCLKEIKELKEKVEITDFYFNMVQKIYDDNPDDLINLMKNNTLCSFLQQEYFKKFPQAKLLLTKESKDKIQEAIKEYFKDENKDGNLKFVKDCLSLTLFKDNCSNKVLIRIQEFVQKIKNALELPNIPVSFRLSDIDARVNSASISRAHEILTEEQRANPAVQALISMCSDAPPTPPEVPQEFIQGDVVTSGGRRSRYRRRPTKKYFKSRHRRHSSSKKKRHMKTKRHMKRHRKTKRHMKRY